MFEQGERLFLIGGASGVGKSMLAEAITNQKLAVYKKIHSFAPDIAKDKNCELKTVFDTDFFVPETINRMVVFVKKYQFVVSDLHYAIQPKADTAFFLEGEASKDILLAEKYRAAFAPENLKVFKNNHIDLVPILITCGVDQLVQRKAQIVERPIKGGSDKKIAQKELSAEFSVYKNIIKQLDLTPYIFTNSKKEPTEFHKEVIGLLFKTPT